MKQHRVRVNSSGVCNLALMRKIENEKIQLAVEVLSISCETNKVFPSGGAAHSCKEFKYIVGGGETAPERS